MSSNSCDQHDRKPNIRKKCRNVKGGSRNDKYQNKHYFKQILTRKSFAYFCSSGLIWTPDAGMYIIETSSILYIAW